VFGDLFGYDTPSHLTVNDGALAVTVDVDMTGYAYESGSSASYQSIDLSADMWLQAWNEPVDNTSGSFMLGEPSYIATTLLQDYSIDPEVGEHIGDPVNLYFGGSLSHSGWGGDPRVTTTTDLTGNEDLSSPLTVWLDDGTDTWPVWESGPYGSDVGWFDSPEIGAAIGDRIYVEMAVSAGLQTPGGTWQTLDPGDWIDEEVFSEASFDMQVSSAAVVPEPPSILLGATCFLGLLVGRAALRKCRAPDWRCSIDA